MNKETITYTIVGVVLGLVLGFMVANWTAGSSTGGATASQGDQASVNGGGTPQLPPGHPSVNGGGQQAGATQLPPGHPDINSGQTIPAGPLPQGSTGQPTAAPPEFPSLDPLPASSTEERAGKKYKNIQVLKDVPASQWMSIMFAFKQSLGVECTYCHVADAWDKDDKQPKQIARKMIKMVHDINSQYVGGMGGRVDCFTCHRGQTKPAS